MSGAGAVSEQIVVGLCLAIYNDPASVAWDHIWPKGFGVVAHKCVLNTDVVIWRGSKDPLDWYRDLDACTYVYPGLGRVHAGFMAGVAWRRRDVDAACGPNVIVAGHSLGAAEAALHAGLRTAAGQPPAQVYLYGCPRPGMQALAGVLKPVPITSRRNGADPVTTVPWDVPRLDPFCAVRPMIEMHVPAAPGDGGLFREHHCELYAAGVNALAGK